MSERPWLAIIIPAYNADRYLGACLESIAPAEHPDVQVIVVDDGSTDETSGICDQYAAACDNVSVIHRGNGGSPSARNAGLACADGDWVWFVDSDDAIHPEALRFLRRVTEASNGDMVHFKFCYFADGSFVPWGELGEAHGRLLLPNDFLRGIYSGAYQHFTCSFLYRTEFLGGLRRGQGPFREDFSLYEDVVSTEEAVRRARGVEVLDSPLYGYRQVGTSITHRRSNGSADSGLRAVRSLESYPALDDAAQRDKARMEISLLFSAYKLAESNEAGRRIAREIRGEIARRVRSVGFLSLGAPRMVRYAMLKTGAIDAIVAWRSRGSR